MHRRLTTLGALSGYANTEIKDWHEFYWDSLRCEQDLISHTTAALGIWTELADWYCPGEGRVDVSRGPAC